MSSPLQVAVLFLLGRALWSIFYIVNVLSREGEKPTPKRSSARRPPARRENERAVDT